MLASREIHHLVQRVDSLVRRMSRRILGQVRVSLDYAWSGSWGLSGAHQLGDSLVTWPGMARQRTCQLPQRAKSPTECMVLMGRSHKCGRANFHSRTPSSKRDEGGREEEGTEHQEAVFKLLVLRSLPFTRKTSSWLVPLDAMVQQSTNARGHPP